MIGKWKWNDYFRKQKKYTNPWNYVDTPTNIPLWFKGFLGNTRGVWIDSLLSRNVLIKQTLFEQKNVNYHESKIKHNEEHSEYTGITEMNVSQSTN